MKKKIILFLRRTESFTNTDMVYLASSGFWITMNTLAVSGISFALSIVFANLLSKETFGIYQFVLSIATILSAFTLTGMNTVITKRTAQGVESVLLSSIKPQLLFNICAGILGLAISTYYALKGNNAYAGMFLMVGVAVPLIATYNSYTAFLNGKRAFKRLFIVSVFLALFYSLGMVLAVLIGASPIALVGVYFLTNTLGVYACFLYTKKIYGLSTSEKLDLGFVKKLSISNIPSSLLLSIDNIVIYHLLGPSTLALYAIATQLPERALSFLRSITTAAIPKFSTYSHSQMRAIIFAKTARMFTLALLGAGVYAVLAKTIFSYVFPEYMGALTTSYLGGVASAFGITGSFVLSALITSHNGRRVFAVNVIYPTISIICIVTGGMLGGMHGAIIGKMLGSLGAIVIGLTAINYVRPQDH